MLASSSRGFLSAVSSDRLSDSGTSVHRFFRVQTALNNFRKIKRLNTLSLAAQITLRFMRRGHCFASVLLWVGSWRAYGVQVGELVVTPGARR